MLGIGSMWGDSGLPQVGRHPTETKSYAGLRNVRSADQVVVSLAAAAMLGAVGGCSAESEFSVTTLVLREVPSCAVEPADPLRVGGRGDFPAVERQIDSSAPVPIAESTSWTMSTKLAMLSGTLLHASGGDTWSPACVYFAGICPPSVHALDVSVITAMPPRPPPLPPRPAGGG